MQGGTAVGFKVRLHPKWDCLMIPIWWQHVATNGCGLWHLVCGLLFSPFVPSLTPDMREVLIKIHGAYGIETTSGSLRM